MRTIPEALDLYSDDLTTDFPCYDPFDPGMVYRDRRDICDVYGSPISWCPLASVQATLAQGIPDAYPRGRIATTLPKARAPEPWEMWT